MAWQVILKQTLHMAWYTWHGMVKWHGMHAGDSEAGGALREADVSDGQDPGATAARGACICTCMHVYICTCMHAYTCVVWYGLLLTGTSQVWILMAWYAWHP